MLCGVRRLMDCTTIVAAGLGLSRKYLGRFVISDCLGRTVKQRSRGHMEVPESPERLLLSCAKDFSVQFDLGAHRPILR